MQGILGVLEKLCVTENSMIALFCYFSVLKMCFACFYMQSPLGVLEKPCVTENSIITLFCYFLPIHLL